MRKVLLSLTLLIAGAMSVWAQTEYVVSYNTGKFNKGWASEWAFNTSDEQPAGLKLITTNEAGNMQGDGAEMHIYSGKGVLECTYRLSVDLPYQITGYSYKYKDSGSTHNKTISIGETTYDVKTEVQTISVDGLATQTTDFTLKGANEKVTLTDFKVLITKLETVSITYSYKYDGKNFATEKVTAFVGVAFPAPATLPYGISATLPERSVLSSDADKTFEVECTDGNLPFTYADSYEKITDWYYLTLNKYYLYNDGTSNEMYALKNTVDENNEIAYAWAFIGNPVDGFKVVNKNGGCLNATNNGAIVGNEEHTFTLTASTYHQPNGFFMAAEGKQRYNRNGNSGKIVYWSGADGGSTFNVETAEVGLVGAGTAESPYLIKNVYDLVFFRNSVNAGETTYNAEGKYVALGADIDLAGVANWEPIGSWDYTFDGNFDGQGHKIMNLKMSDNSAANGEAYLGLFGITANNVIKDFVIENVTIESAGQIVAAAIAYPYYTTVSDIKVCGEIAIKGGNYTAGVLAYTRHCVNASNLVVSGNANSYITGAQAVGGVISDIQMNGGLKAEYSNFSVSGVSITGTKMVGGISGIIATQTLNGASVKNVTLASGDSRVGVISGAFGGTSTISNVVVENVKGATAIVGPTYDGAHPVEAKVGYTYYSTLAEAVKATGNVELLTEVTLKDDVAYASTSRKTVDGKITYTRNLIAGWNPIYLPFATELSTEKYDVATFTSAEGETVTLTKIEDATATLAANTAYVIRPKNEAAKTLTFALTDATLEAATVNTQELGEGFSVKGNYSELTGSKLGANDRVVGTNGNWGVLKSDSKLRPYRLILTIPATAKAISMRVEGEDVTSIENLGITIEGDVIFDLMGRRVETMTEGGIYIVNGKKIVF